MQCQPVSRLEPRRSEDTSERGKKYSERYKNSSSSSLIQRFMLIRAVSLRRCQEARAYASRDYTVSIFVKFCSFIFMAMSNLTLPAQVRHKIDFKM
jgi:hypothetical protein